MLVTRDNSLRAAVAGGLTMEGLEVRAREDEQAGLASIAEREPRLVVLDDGALARGHADFLSRLRRVTWAAVIVIGPGDNDALASALLRGADMYMNRPFDPTELISRARALLRRSRHGLSEAPCAGPGLKARPGQEGALWPASPTALGPEGRWSEDPFAAHGA